MIESKTKLKIGMGQGVLKNNQSSAAPPPIKTSTEPIVRSNQN